MEDGLVQIMKISVKGGGAVLILVVMEDGLVHVSARLDTLLAK